MGMANKASRNSTKSYGAGATGASGALTVASGAPVTVYGITLYAGTTKAVFTITDAADVTLAVIGVPAAITNSIEVCWKADAGIKIQIGSVNGSPNATVFHDSPGN